MKFIQIADTHLGARPDTNKPWGEKRERELWETFELVIKEADKRDVDMVLIAGDLFHGQPLLRELKEVNFMLSTLRRAKVIIIAGNHDYIRENSYYNTFEWCENVYFLGDEEMDRIVLDDLQTDIYGFSYHSQEITQNRYDAIEIEDKDKINILLAHGGDEKHVPINKKRLKYAGFDYIAFGHIHKPEIDSSIPMGYCGSLEPMNVNETGNHGFIYGEVDERGCHVELIPFAKRKYIHKSLHDDGTRTNASLRQEIQEILTEEGIENIYKFNIKGFRNSEINYDIDYLKCLGNIVQVDDQTVPYFDFTRLEQENRGNLLGRFIHNMEERTDSVGQKALFYGTKALLDAMKKS